MADALEDWILLVRNSSIPRTQAVEAEVEAEVAELLSRVEILEDPGRLERLRREIEAGIALLMDRERALETEIAERERDRLERRRRETERILTETADLLARHQASLDVEIVAASRTILRESPFDLSPAELEPLLARRAPVAAEIRAAMEALLLAAHEEVQGLHPLLGQLEGEQRRLQETEEKTREIRRRLHDEHEVSPAVLESLDGLAMPDVIMVRQDLLDPWIQDARIEREWGLQVDVLAPAPATGQA